MKVIRYIDDSGYEPLGNGTSMYKGSISLRVRFQGQMTGWSVFSYMACVCPGTAGIGEIE